jgi:enterochelin esterase-like enzyme/uncharacterized damage-inducible protein DinB
MYSLVEDEPVAKMGTQRREEVLISEHLGREVQLSILLPPSELVTIGETYPVLYLNDGQDLAALGLVATLDNLFARSALQPFIVVALHATEDRVQEYGVAGQPDYHGRGSRAGAYTDFVLQELLPWAQLHYKVSADPAQAVFAGFSLGGLSAFDLVWQHPDAFARAGVFSGSFWWRRLAVGAGYTPADRIMHERVRAGQLHPRHQFWLQTGTLDERNDRNENGVIDSVEDCLDLLDELVKLGLDVHQSVRYVQVEGGRHHADTWGRVLPDFLSWAFGRPEVINLPAPLPVVRLQLDPRLSPALVPADAPAVESRPTLLLPEVPSATDEEALPELATAETHSPLSSELTMDTTASLPLARPVAGDYTPYYERYINLVPAGVDPRQVLREQPREVHAAFDQLSGAQALFAYAPDKWTIKQLLLHQIDAERIFAYRALRFARGDEQSLHGFDENEYAANSQANERSLSSLLAEYDANRAATLALFDSFNDEQLNRKGSANNAVVTVRALLYIMAGHERHHLNIFQERYQPLL